jgi:hypothetical protein
MNVEETVVAVEGALHERKRESPGRPIVGNFKQQSRNKWGSPSISKWSLERQRIQTGLYPKFLFKEPQCSEGLFCGQIAEAFRITFSCHCPLNSQVQQHLKETTESKYKAKYQ